MSWRPAPSIGCTRSLDSPCAIPNSRRNFYVGLTPTEAADALEIPVGTAKSRLHYAIEALRVAIAADERTSVGATREGRMA